MSRRNFGTVKSLLHFDYPYFNEPNDGLDDEVGLLNWSKSSNNVKLAGTQIPYALNAAPKFGYRCAYFTDASSYIQTNNTNGVFNLAPSGDYEFECFVKFTSNPVTFSDSYAFYNGHTYWKTYCSNSFNITWDIIERFKSNWGRGAYLAAITSAEENEIIRNLAGSTTVVLGGLYNSDTSSWEWISGEDWSYTNWADGQPGSGSYLWMYQDGNGKWSSTQTFPSMVYPIVEYDYDMHNEPRGDLINLGDALKLSITNNNTLGFQSEAWGISCASTVTPQLNSWQHIMLRISDRTAKVYLNGQLVISTPISSNTEITPETVKLGGYASYMDEFVFRHSAGSRAPKIPSAPYSGVLDISKTGWYKGVGDRILEPTTIDSNTALNQTGRIKTITGSRTFSVYSWASAYDTITVGSEVMLHISEPKSTNKSTSTYWDIPVITDYPLVGMYAFAKVESIDGNNVVLDTDITRENNYDFTLNSELLDLYYVQVISVPCYEKLTVNASIIPVQYVVQNREVVALNTYQDKNYDSSNKRGGIVALRTIGDCAINGSILTSGTGPIRYDIFQMTHNKLIDRFLCSQGGGIFIACGGTFTASSTARLGASWSGLGENGNGAAGYGGNGGSVNPSATISGAGGAGGVGGGGGGAACISASTSAGYVVNGGAVGSNGLDGRSGSGGGGCGGNGGNGTSYAGGSGGGGQANTGGSGGTGKDLVKSGTTYKNDGKNAIGVNGGNYGIYDPNPTAEYASTLYYGGAGGGAPGGNGGEGASEKSATVYSSHSGGIAGTSIILICDTLNADEAALSTGGASGGSTTTGYTRAGGAGGGGTGFCYIACREKVSA